MPAQTHLMLKVPTEELVNAPEDVLFKMSMKIQEKRHAILKDMIHSQVYFQSVDGVRQGTCVRIESNVCTICVHDSVYVHVPLHRILM